MRKITLRLLTVTLMLMLALSGAVLAKSANQQRAEIGRLHTKALANLYEVNPNAQDVIAGSYGYATISSTGAKIGLFGSAHGRGLAVNNVTGERVYMKMEEYALGIGLGVKEYDLIFVFGSEHAWDSFVSGKFKVGGEATASATDGYSGGAIDGADVVAKDMWVYQVTTKGLAVGVSLKGLSIYPNKDLN